MATETPFPGTHTPSLQNPTREFLDENFTKVELQKHCRKLGLKKIWGRKYEIIELIIENYRENRINSGDVRNSQETAQPLPTENEVIRKLQADITEIKGRLDQKTFEIDELNLMLKAANVTINRLNDRLSYIEEHARDRRMIPVSELSETTTHEASTLILGDTNLKDIRSSDLGENTYIRTLNGANIDLIKSWVSEELKWEPTRCILICGIHDILEEEITSNILDNMGGLISELKKINGNMEIVICQLFPTLQTNELGDIIDYHNSQLEEWGSDNGIPIMNC